MNSVDILLYSVFENESRSGPKLPHRFSSRFLSNHVILFISSVEIYSFIFNQSLSIKQYNDNMQYRRKNIILLRDHFSVRCLQNHRYDKLWDGAGYPAGASIFNYLWYMRQEMSTPASGYIKRNFQYIRLVCRWM